MGALGAINSYAHCARIGGRDLLAKMGVPQHPNEGPGHERRRVARHALGVAMRCTDQSHPPVRTPCPVTRPRTSAAQIPGSHRLHERRAPCGRWVGTGCGTSRSGRADGADRTAHDFQCRRAISRSEGLTTVIRASGPKIAADAAEPPAGALGGCVASTATGSGSAGGSKPAMPAMRAMTEAIGSTGGTRAAVWSASNSDCASRCAANALRRNLRSRRNVAWARASTAWYSATAVWLSEERGLTCITWPPSRWRQRRAPAAPWGVARICRAHAATVRPGASARRRNAPS